MLDNLNVSYMHMAGSQAGDHVATPTPNLDETQASNHIVIDQHAWLSSHLTVSYTCRAAHVCTG